MAMNRKIQNYTNRYVFVVVCLSYAHCSNAQCSMLIHHYNLFVFWVRKFYNEKQFIYKLSTIVDTMIDTMITSIRQPQVNSNNNTFMNVICFPFLTEQIIPAQQHSSTTTQQNRNKKTHTQNNNNNDCCCLPFERRVQ